MKRRILGEFRGIKADIISHQVWETSANALILHLPQARSTLSSRDGFRKISVVCNCYLPESLWSSFHDYPDTWKTYLKEVLNEINQSPDEATALSTGVNMEHLAWAEEVYEQLWVLTFVTAGVKSNAMRVGKDRASNAERNGQFKEVGTINIILLTNASLNAAALAASFITITEAKNIALQELDVRSSYNPGWQATGTGTDEIVVIPGRDIQCTYVGGHTKIGELMARTVTSATIDAIRKESNVSD